MSDRPTSIPPDVWEAVVDEKRLETLRSLDAMTPATDDADFDRIARLAAAACDMPAAMISLVDAERKWFVASVGMTAREVPIESSFCAHTIAARGRRWLSLPDVSADPRFARNPLVTGPPHARSYAGAPIAVRGQRIGTLCVLAPETREVAVERLRRLADLADLAATLFALKDEARRRARADAALVLEEWRHALTLEAGNVGSWAWDIGSGEVVGNAMLRRMFGLPREGALEIGQFFGVIHPDDQERVRKALDEAMAEGGADYAEQFRVGAEANWLMGRGRVYQRDEAGRAVVIMGVTLDITETKRAEQNTALLLRELNHRVKNTLAMIQALARQTLRETPDPARFIEAFGGRLRTLSDAHALLSDRDWTGIGLHELVQMQVAPYDLSNGERVALEGADVELPPDHALGLGLILHELASNAARYGALSTTRGEVRIAASLTPPPTAGLVLDWIERGGPRVRPPSRRGFGSVLIERSLDKVLGSTVAHEFAPEGVEARISMPL